MGREGIMKLNISAAATASSLLWGGAVMSVGIINMFQPRYGGEFLDLVASIYPGYRHRRDPREIAIGTAYALLDGAVGGAIFAALYNCFVPDSDSEAGAQG
jgi:hypothetical protein